MSVPLVNEFDFPLFLKALEDKSLEEIQKTVADRIADLEIRSISVKGPDQCRDVGMLKFLFELKEMQELLRSRGVVAPVTTSRAEVQIYRPLFEALIARRELPDTSMDVFTQPKSSYGSFYESELERQAEDAAAQAASPETSSTPPPLPVQASVQEPPPLPAQINLKEPPPLPVQRDPKEPPPLPRS
jgi:hypothetical protein